MGDSIGGRFPVGKRLHYGVGSACLPQHASTFSTSLTVALMTINTNMQAQMSDIPMMFPRFVGGATPRPPVVNSGLSASVGCEGVRA